MSTLDARLAAMPMAAEMAALKANFSPDKVSFRAGRTMADKPRAIALAYIDARHIEDRLDNVVGPGGWQCEYVPMNNGTTCCRLGIKIDGEWVWKASGNADAPVSGDYSEAFTLAASKWGIGRYLHDFETVWVDLSDNWIAATELPKLRAMLAKMTSAAKAPVARASDRIQFQAPDRTPIHDPATGEVAPVADEIPWITPPVPPSTEPDTSSSAAIRLQIVKDFSNTKDAHMMPEGTREHVFRLEGLWDRMTKSDQDAVSASICQHLIDILVWLKAENRSAMVKFVEYRDTLVDYFSAADAATFQAKQNAVRELLSSQRRPNSRAVGMEAHQ